MHFARARLTSHLGHGLAESLSLRLLGIGQKISTTEDTEGTENDLAPPCAPVPPVVKLSVRVAAPDAKRRTHAFCPRSSHFSFGTRARRIALLAPPGNRSEDLNHRGHRGHREMI